jgi:hypothetical protein
MLGAVEPGFGNRKILSESLDTISCFLGFLIYFVHFVRKHGFTDTDSHGGADL